MDEGRKLLYGAGAVAALLALLSAADGRGLRRYLKLSEEARQHEEQVHGLRRENAQLVRELKALTSDPRAMERAAREDLGYVRPGEVIFNLE